MLDSLSRSYLVLCFFIPAFIAQNAVLSSTNPDIIYNPPLCTPSSTAAGCTSPWQSSNSTIPGTTIVYTNGPIPQAGNVIPQMFLNFRASALYLRTTSLSNATVNFTLTAEPTDVFTTHTVNTSINNIIAIDIPEAQTTTLGVTFVDEGLLTRFDVESISLTVTNASATSSFLPSASLPFSISPPTFVPSSTTSSTPNSGTSNNKGTIIGAVLGGVLGATLLVVIFAAYRYRKRLPTFLRQRVRMPRRNR